MANTKISAFTAETNVANITGFAAFKTVGGSSTNVRISGSEIESTLNLSNFAVGTLAVDRGGTGATTFTANGILIGNTASAISATAELADGQLLIGHTGNAPVAATLTQGTDLSITNGNGSINIGHATISNTPGSSSTTLSAGGTFTAIDSVTVSAQGHLTAQNTKTYTLPSDTNTTYDLTAPSAGTLRLSGSDSTTDDVTISGSSGITISQLAANNINAALGSTITIGTGGSARGLVDIQGGSNLDAQLRLNCSAGTHAVVIEGPDHLSGSANYIVKLPHGAPAVNKILKVGTYAANTGTYADPSLATMIWADDTDTSIYAANGNLTGARTVTMGGNNLTFASTTAGQEVKFEQNVEVAGQGYTDLYTGATIDGIDWDNGNVQEVILPNSATDFDPSNAEPGATYILILKQPASGAAGTINWAGGSGTVRWPGGTPPTLSTANNAVDIVTLVCVNTNSTYYATSVLNLS